MRIKEIKNLFFVNEKNIDSDLLLAALTHQKELNDNRQNINEYKKYIDSKVYYNDFGKAVFIVLLNNFIYDNYSTKDQFIIKGTNSSKIIFMNKFIETYNLRDILIYEETMLNERALINLAYDLIGFIYLNSSYENVKRIFRPVFKVELLEFIDNYVMLIQNIYKLVNVPFTQIDEFGSDHEKTFVCLVACGRYGFVCNSREL